MARKIAVVIELDDECSLQEIAEALWLGLAGEEVGTFDAVEDGEPFRLYHYRGGQSLGIATFHATPGHVCPLCAGGW